MSVPFFARVKSVVSGDTLILTGVNGPAKERTFSLAHVSAPRLGRDGDEPWAYQCREYLRNLVQGKQVKCTVLYTIPNSGREFGFVELQSGERFPDAAVAAGWLKVREDAGRKEDSEEALERVAELRKLEGQAKSAARGIFEGGSGVIEVQYDLGTPDFFNQWKGKTVDGVVERVIAGDRLVTRLVLSDKKHLQTSTLLAGIRTPANDRVINGQVQPGGEYGNEAKTFVEDRLHQRAVKIKIVGASPNGQLIATVLHPRGNIAEILLSEGFARCNDHHSTLLGADMAALRNAEKKAQSAHLRLHKNFAGKVADSTNSDATVAKIISADAIIVRDRSGTEKRLTLSSIRGPRVGESTEAPFREDAKEFLRKKLIGKHIRYTIDGSRPATEDFEARDVATVTQGGNNINLLVVQEGYASVIRHRKDDTDRAPNYDELLAAQETAKQEKKGMWSEKPPKVTQYVDVSASVQKAKIQASTLSKRKVAGVVDYCKSGSKFTILIPREGIKLTLLLAGVRVPRSARSGQQDGEPFGQEALDLAYRRCNQRDCEIDVSPDVDKAGALIGELYINRESFSKILVEEGLASVHEYAAEKAGNAAELRAAQKRAKEARKGIWHDWDPSQEETAEGTEAAPANADIDTSGTVETKPQDYRNIIITDIDSAGKIKFQEVGKGVSALTTMMNDFKKFNLDSKNNVAIKENPKIGDLVSARFSGDGEWYRARIRSNDRAAKVAEVVYIDYGNTEKHPWAKLRPLDAQFSTQRVKAQALDARLSFVQLPTGADYLRDAVDYLREVAGDRQLVGSFDFVDAKENTNWVTLFEPSPSGSPQPKETESINRDVILNGHAMVPKKLKAWERSKVFEPVLKSLKEAEKQAKDSRLGMWEYGDITED